MYSFAFGQSSEDVINYKLKKYKLTRKTINYIEKYRESMLGVTDILVQGYRAKQSFLSELLKGKKLFNIPKDKRINIRQELKTKIPMQKYFINKIYFQN